MSRTHMAFGPKVPWSWVAFVSQLHSDGIPCAIAGGAVRDLLNNRPHRDVDIWTYSVSDETVTAHAEANAWELVADMGTYGSCGSGLGRVWKVVVDGEEFNVITTSFKNIVEVMARFDFGFSRAAITLTGDAETPCHISVTDEYLEDLVRKVFRVRYNNGEGRALKRYLRLSEKYPGWDFEDLPQEAPPLL